jgi:hypothetical protein
VASPPYFVISTGRCGSTFLSEILGRDPKVLSVSEFLFSMGPEPFPPGEVPGSRVAEMFARTDPITSLALAEHEEPSEFRYPVDAGLRFDRETGVPAIATITLPFLTPDPDPLYDNLIAFAASLPLAPISRHYAAIFDWLRSAFGRDVWVERSGGSLHWLPILMQEFPDARFIHLFRDGRETAISMSKRHSFRLMLIGLEIQRLTGVNPYTTVTPPPMRDLPEPFSRMLPGSFDFDTFRNYEIPLERFGLHWASTILRGLRHLRRVEPERLLSISYEHLVSDPGDTLSRMATFLGLDVSEGWIASSAKAARRQPSNWLSLPELERGRLHAACRIANARLYGSDGPPVWSSSELVRD